MLGSKKGIAMLIVISFMLIALILAAGILTISSGHFSTSYSQMNRSRAFSAAEAGMQHALWKCRTGGYDLTTGGNETITITDPNYSLDAAITIGPPVAGLNPITVKVSY